MTHIPAYSIVPLDKLLIFYDTKKSQGIPKLFLTIESNVDVFELK
ncbi:hypothetical protein AQEC111735_12990 [Aquirufa ecclesiirivi]